MPDREKLIELIAEAEENAINICVYNSDCEDCPGRKYGNKCREYLKADHLISNGVTVRERGRWEDSHEIKSFRHTNIPVVQCSKCQVYFCDIINNHHYMYHYCPNCGADMRGEEDG